jgi:hypothetical protein
MGKKDRRIFLRDKKRMIEIGDLAKEFAESKDFRKKLGEENEDAINKMAFAHIFNEASCGGYFSFVLRDGDYEVANKNDFLQRLLMEKDKTDKEEPT